MPLMLETNRSLGSARIREQKELKYIAKAKAKAEARAKARGA